MMDAWACAAVLVAFVGGFGLGLSVAVQRINAPVQDYNRKLRAVRVVVVNEGRRIQQVARMQRPALALFGLASVSDQFEAIGDKLVECDDPDDPVSEPDRI